MGSTRVFNSDLTIPSLQQFINYTPGFPALTLVPGMVSAGDLRAIPLWFFVSASFTSFMSSTFALWPNLSDRLKKSCWFFLVCSAFYLLGWWLLSSLHSRAETGNHMKYILIIVKRSELSERNMAAATILNTRCDAPQHRLKFILLTIPYAWSVHCVWYIVFGFMSL